MSNNILPNPSGASISSFTSSDDLSSLVFRDVASPPPPPGNLGKHTIVQTSSSSSSSSSSNTSTSSSSLNQQKEVTFRKTEAEGEARFHKGDLNKFSQVQPKKKFPVTLPQPN